MRVFHKHGSKERLFEMIQKVNKLNEDVLPQNERVKVIEDFILFVIKKLNITTEIPSIRLSHNENDAKSMKSYGRYMPESNEIVVVMVNRGLADILRTIAHELVHHKQKELGAITLNSGETGSKEENEANALAGILMREFGKNNPIIFE